MKYLSWKCELKIIKTRFGKYILRKEADDVSGIFEYLLNDTAVKIVSTIDGTKTYDEIKEKESKGQEYDFGDSQ